MTPPLSMCFMTTYVPRGPRAPTDSFYWLKYIKRGHRSTHFMITYVPRGPRDTFGWFKCIERDHRFLMHLMTTYVGLNASTGVIG